VQNPARQGDTIPLVEGAHVPFALRPACLLPQSVTENRYQLIGEAFVTGEMYGELYEGLDPDEVDYNIELI
jgi:hypothetical protein